MLLLHRIPSFFDPSMVNNTIFRSWKFVTNIVVLNRPVKLSVLDFFKTHVMLMIFATSSVSVSAPVARSSDFILINHSVFISIHMLLSQVDLSCCSLLFFV